MVPIEKAGTRWEYKKPDEGSLAIGFEVTDEGDLSFYVEQVLGYAVKGFINPVRNLVKGYAKTISTIAINQI